MKRARAPSPTSDSRAGALNAALLGGPRALAAALRAAPSASPGEAALDGESAEAPVGAVGAAAAWARVARALAAAPARAAARAGGDWVARHAPFAAPLEHGSQGSIVVATGRARGASGALEWVEARRTVSDFVDACLEDSNVLRQNAKYLLLSAAGAGAALRELRALLADRVTRRLHEARTERERAEAVDVSIDDLAAEADRRGLALAPLLRAAVNLCKRVGLRLSHWSTGKAAKAGGSYGRFFSQPAIFETVARALRPLMDEETIFVDFSCGTNDFGFLLGARRWVGFDLFPPPGAGACPAHFRLKNWLDVEALPGSPADAREALVGLNPPFGTKGVLATRFVERAFALGPRLVALITPPATPALALVAAETAAWAARVAAAAPALAGAPRAPRLRDFYAAPPPPGGGARAAARAAARHVALALVPPPEWVLVHYDAALCGGHSFYMPGEGAAIRNEEPPVFAIISRGDAILHPDDAVVVPNAKGPEGWYRAPWRA